tara:strand:- start:368 stop:496 length:129 start_codon:yes stop_codon:yes gene_type:complete
MVSSINKKYIIQNSAGYVKTPIKLNPETDVNFIPRGIAETDE